MIKKMLNRHRYNKERAKIIKDYEISLHNIDLEFEALGVKYKETYDILDKMEIIEKQNNLLNLRISVNEARIIELHEFEQKYWN